MGTDGTIVNLSLSLSRAIPSWCTSIVAHWSWHYLCTTSKSRSTLLFVTSTGLDSLIFLLLCFAYWLCWKVRNIGPYRRPLWSLSDIVNPPSLAIDWFFTFDLKHFDHHECYKHAYVQSPKAFLDRFNDNLKVCSPAKCKRVYGLVWNWANRYFPSQKLRDLFLIPWSCQVWRAAVRWDSSFWLTNHAIPLDKLKEGGDNDDLVTSFWKVNFKSEIQDIKIWLRRELDTIIF